MQCVLCVWIAYVFVSQKLIRLSQFTMCELTETMCVGNERVLY
jgi:hypothetical protein